MKRTVVTRKRIMTLVIVLALAGSLAWAYQTINGSAEGTVSNEVPQADLVEAYVPISSEYATFEVPASFTTLDSQKPALPVLKNYNYLKEQFGSWQCAIQVTRIASGRLEDSGTYNYRAKNTDRYAMETKQYDGREAVIFSDKTSQIFTKVGYIKQGTLSASVSLLGGTPEAAEDMQKTLDHILSTWVWK